MSSTFACIDISNAVSGVISFVMVVSVRSSCRNYLNGLLVMVQPVRVFPVGKHGTFTTSTLIWFKNVFAGSTRHSMQVFDVQYLFDLDAWSSSQPVSGLNINSSRQPVQTSQLLKFGVVSGHFHCRFRSSWISLALSDYHIRLFSRSESHFAFKLRPFWDVLDSEMHRFAS